MLGEIGDRLQHSWLEYIALLRGDHIENARFVGVLRENLAVGAHGRIVRVEKDAVVGVEHGVPDLEGEERGEQYSRHYDSPAKPDQ